MNTPQNNYSIYRFYAEEGKKRKLIKTNLTEKQAREHCEDPTTRKEGVWFDGFVKN